MAQVMKKADRRVLRTQAALREAMIRLLRRKGYEDITIQEILAEANVGRSTFYAHCVGKDQLLRLCLRMLREELAGECGSRKEAQYSHKDRILAFSLPLLVHMAGHRDLYPSLAHGHGNDLFMRELRQLVVELAKSDLASLPKGGHVPHEILVQYVVGTFMALVTWWIERNSKMSPPALNDLFQRLVRHGIGT
jgi:AcrR family transcriptional regulator